MSIPGGEIWSLMILKTPFSGREEKARFYDPVRKNGVNDQRRLSMQEKSMTQSVPLEISEQDATCMSSVG